MFKRLVESIRTVKRRRRRAKLLKLRAEEFKARKSAVMRGCGCVCYCPHCNDILNDQSSWEPIGPEDDGHGTYHCTKCGSISEWHFGIAPVPICLKPKI